MDTNILCVEYQALREEILTTQRRDSRLISLGALILPGINVVIQSNYVAKSWPEAQAVVLALPLLILTVVLMHLGNTHAITRIGRYIREQLEPQFYPDGRRGWETWLEQRDGEQSRRRAEHYMRLAVSLVFGLYYCSAIWLAFRFVQKTNVTLAIAVLGVYLMLGIGLGFHLWKNLPTNTEFDPHPLYPMSWQKLLGPMLVVRGIARSSARMFSTSSSGAPSASPKEPRVNQ